MHAEKSMEQSVTVRNILIVLHQQSRCAVYVSSPVFPSEAKKLRGNITIVVLQRYTTIQTRNLRTRSLGAYPGSLVLLEGRYSAYAPNTTTTNNDINNARNVG